MKCRKTYVLNKSDKKTIHINFGSVLICNKILEVKNSFIYNLYRRVGILTEYFLFEKQALTRLLKVIGIQKQFLKVTKLY